MQVQEGMSEVFVTLGPDAHAARGGGADGREGTGAALVADDELPVPGIVTERDILISIGAGEDPDAERVGDHMSDERDHRRPRLEPRARRRGDVAPRRPPPGRLRRGDLVGILSMRDIVRVWTSDGATSA